MRSLSHLTFFSLVILLFGLTSCAPSETAIQTAIAQTALAKPTDTPLPTATATTTASSTPTNTPIPTATIKPTITPRPTKTPTETPFPTATPTFTPTPTDTPPFPTQTAQARETARVLATQSRVATQTQQAATKTQQATDAQATQTQRAVDVQETRAAKTATATFLAQYGELPYRELRDYANSHYGEKVCVRGRVFNVVGTDTIQMYFAGTYDALYVEFADDFTGIYERDTITVCGVVKGYKSFENIMGATISQPYLANAFRK
jgi:hypothetical protein